MVDVTVLTLDDITEVIPMNTIEQAHIFRELVDKQEEPKRRFFTCESFIEIGKIKRVIAIEEEN